MEELLKTSHLSKFFGDFQAVKDVSFTVQKGDIYGFLGPNGAGKSTTLRIILGLIYKSAGSVQLFGNEIPAKEAIPLYSENGDLPFTPES